MRRDLELISVVQHCRNLFALRCVELILLCWSSSLSAGFPHVCVARLPPASSFVFLIKGGSSLPNLVPETFDVPSSGGLIESILHCKSLCQRRAQNLGSPRFLCELWNLNLILNTLWTAPAASVLCWSVLCWTTGTHHFGPGSNPRHLDCFISSSLKLWDFVSASSRDRQQTLLMNFGW